MSTAIRPLRIVLVEFLPAGGMFQFALLMGEALARQGHDVELLTAAGPEVQSREPGLRIVPKLPTWRPAAVSAPPGARMLHAARNFVQFCRSWVRTIRHLARIRPDVAQFADFVKPIDALFTGFVRWRCLATVLTDLAHDPIPLAEHRLSGPLYKRSPVLRAGLNLAYRAMDVVLVLGPYAKSQLCTQYRGLRRIEIIPHGSYHSYPNGDVTPAQDAPPTILFFGTWSRYKGVDLLLDAFARLRRTVPEARLVMAGAISNDVDGDAVARRAADIGNVELIPRYVEVDEVGPLFGRSRLAVVPYVEGTQSGVVHLSFTFGRAVVATDVGDLAEVVTDQTGVLVPAGDVEALAAAMARLIDRPQLAGRLGAQARSWVENDAGWDAVAGRLVDIYRDAIRSRTPR